MSSIHGQKVLKDHDSDYGEAGHKRGALQTEQEDKNQKQRHNCYFIVLNTTSV